MSSKKSTALVNDLVPVIEKLQQQVQKEVGDRDATLSLIYGHVRSEVRLGRILAVLVLLLVVGLVVMVVLYVQLRKKCGV